MENATKALMIAGAVLIAIMIIGVGMMIFNSGNKTITDSIGKLNQIEIQTFNSEFDGYEGNQKGTVVKELLSKIIALNASNDEVHDEKLVHVKVSGKGMTATGDTSASDTTKADTTSTYLTSIRTQITNGKTYNIQFGYTAGLITEITIASNDK
ncbi:MAG: hypothetical protein IJ223_02095 [Clostridia bacterium]|nr:hypothetical protein [Clostridia bacterium]